MPRATPINVDLSWCRTHDLAKITLRDGTILRLGTASISIVEDDNETYAYAPSLMNVSGLKQSLTQSADRVTFSAQNVDRELGLTINDTEKVLIGTQIRMMHAFWDDIQALWRASTLLVGEIADAKVDQEVVNIEALSDLAPDLAFISNRTIASIGSFPQGELSGVIVNPNDFGGASPGGSNAPNHANPPSWWTRPVDREMLPM